MDNSIEIKNLTKKYDLFTLDNVNLKLPKGSIMGLVGENGAGKSTLIKAMLNLTKKDSGEIKFFNKEFERNHVDILANIGVVFEDCYFTGKFTTANIEKILQNTYSTFDSKKYNDYIKRFELPENKAIETYSRGMKMKLSIMIALSHNPKLLIMDEATSGLDPVMRDEILDLFLEFIEDEENSILFSSHITTDLEKVADYITFIADGKIVFSKNKDELLYDYGILKCSKDIFNTIDKSDLLLFREVNNGYEALFKDKVNTMKKFENSSEIIFDKTSIDEIIILYSKGVIL